MKSNSNSLGLIRHAVDEALATGERFYQISVPGSLPPVHLEENVEAAKIELGDDDFKKLSESATF